MSRKDKEAEQARNFLREKHDPVPSKYGMERIKDDLKTMGNVDQEPKLVGRNVVMVLSPLPEGKRVRKFKLSHGDLIEEDDFEEDEDLEGDEDNASDEEEEEAAGKTEEDSS